MPSSFGRLGGCRGRVKKMGALFQGTELVRSGGEGGPRGGLYIFIFANRETHPIADAEKGRKILFFPGERLVKGGKWEGPLPARLRSYFRWGDPALPPPRRGSAFPRSLDLALLLPREDTLPWGLRAPRVAEEYWNGRLRSHIGSRGTILECRGEYIRCSSLDDAGLRSDAAELARGTEHLLANVL